MDEYEKINYLKNINSPFVRKELFSFLNKKEILDIIIYNKEYQMMLSFDIKDYKIMSGKYKIEGKNGKVKEYLIETDDLVFEGEYLNKKKW